MTAFTRRDLAELALLLRVTARAEIMPRFRHLDASDVRTKTGPLDLVTEADTAAERVITEALHNLFPGCVVIGEEAASADKSVLGRLEGAELAFVVDPVDGTANFAAGLPLFGCMAAAIVRGEIASRRRSTIRWATTPQWRCAGRGPGPKRRTESGSN